MEPLGPQHPCTVSLSLSFSPELLSVLSFMLPNMLVLLLPPLGRQRGEPEQQPREQILHNNITIWDLTSIPHVTRPTIWEIWVLGLHTFESHQILSQPVEINFPKRYPPTTHYLFHPPTQRLTHML